MSSTMPSEQHGLHRGGATLFVVASLETLAVGPEQRGELDDARRELLASMGPSQIAGRALLARLAEGVLAGRIDGARVEADVRRVDAAARAVHDAAAGALNRLHSALSPLQRAVLADKVEAHWAVWQRSSIQGSKGATHEQGLLAELRADLALSPAQLERLRLPLPSGDGALSSGDRERIDHGLCAFCDAFRSNVFDGRMLSATGDADARMESWAAEHFAHLVEAVSATLTEEQRAHFAEWLRHAGVSS
jgi:hypothetical protein